MSPDPLAYFDNNATTHVAPEVVEAMLPYLTEFWGNPSSAYRFGRKLVFQLDHAREAVARLVGAEPSEIFFTSGGTEANNAAIHSALLAQPHKRHILTTAVEHASTYNHLRQLQSRGYEITWLPVRPDGTLDLEVVRRSFRPDTAVVSVMWANNETGVLFPVPEVAQLASEFGIPFHTDAVQMIGKLPINLAGLQIQSMALSAHKLHGPKGIGAFCLRKGAPRFPLVIGGHQEHGVRGGTENVAGIVGLGRAAELAIERIADQDLRVRALRDRLENWVIDSVPLTRRIGAAEPRLPNTSLLSFAQVEAEALLLELDRFGICASTGSACNTGSLAPSHVLTAMGLPANEARTCVRFSLGRETNEADLDQLTRLLPSAVAKLRQSVPS